VLALLLFGAASPAHARDPGDDVLTLSGFVAEVEAHSPRLDAARLRTRAARSRVGPARALPDPFVAIGIDELALGMAEAGGERRWPRPVLRYQINQTFPLPRERDARRGAAAATAEAVASNAAITRRALRVAAVQLFLRARYVEAALRTNALLAEALEDVIASAKARYVTGGTAHHDVLLAQAERALLERDALVLRRTLAVLHAEMNELRGRPADDELPALVDDDDARATDRPLSLGAALAQQPELRAAASVIAAADARVRVAETAGRPDLSLQVMAMQSLMPDMPSSVGAMVGVTVPIYWKGKQRPTIDAARQERQAVQRDKDALQQRLEAEWVAAQRAYETSVDTVHLYEQSVLPATRAALESSKMAYVTQQVPFVELLAVLRATLAVELELVAAKTDVRLARLRLEELLAMPSVVRIAPGAPTLFGSMGAGMGSSAMGMSRDAMAPGRPVQLGSGMQPPAGLDAGDRDDGGMGGM
jgi:outer membrane protein, heavy metal efflux system